VDHHILNASFGFYLAILHKYTSIGWAPSGAVNDDAALASLSARSLPGISVCPGIYRTYVDLCDAAKA
jgi:hypothetical protein